VLTESLDEILVLHLVLIVEGKEGLNAGVRRVPKLQGQPTLARKLLLRPYKHQPYVVGPPGRCLGQVIPQCHKSIGPIRGIDRLDVRLLLPLVRRRVIDDKVDHGQGRPLGRGWRLDCRHHHLYDGWWYDYPLFRLDHLLRWPVLLRLRLLPRRLRLWMRCLLPHLWRGLLYLPLLFHICPPHVVDGCFGLSGLDGHLGHHDRPRLQPTSSRHLEPGIAQDHLSRL
jgi:hypothetical protein